MASRLRDLKRRGADISVEVFNELLCRTKCDFCNLPITSGWTPHIDHDHMTGKVRGVLHSGCHRFITNFEKNGLKAEEYLKRGS